MKPQAHHNSPQTATFRPKALTPAQENAIELFLAGKGDTEVARTLGIARETAWSWPEPWQRGQVSIGVPGLAPLPWHVWQRARAS